VAPAIELRRGRLSPAWDGPCTDVMMRMRLARLDGYQRQHGWLGLPLAILYKFFDDRGPYLAALLTYYAFVSLFPLLLLFFSGLGFFLQGHPSLRHQLEHSALETFPVIGPKLSQNVAHFRGSGLGLTVGILGTLYGALGAMQAAQAGFNQIYGVPRNEQPNPVKSRLRSLGLLALLGSGVLLSTVVAVLLSTANGLSRQLSPAIHVGGYVLNYAINVALFTAAFQLLTARQLRTRQVLTGGTMAAGLWMMLQIFGSGYVAARLQRANALYGVFAVVLASIAWLYLQSLILMLAAEVNVVRHRRLWPRGLLTPFTDDVELTAADCRAYEMYARAQRFKGFETVTARFAQNRVAVDRRRSDRHAGDDTTAPSESSASGRTYPPHGAGRSRPSDRAREGISEQQHTGGEGSTMPIKDRQIGIDAYQGRRRDLCESERHREAVIRAEVKRLVHALAPYRVLHREALAREAGADAWHDRGFQRALDAALDAGEVEALPCDFYRLPHP
jgi:membrane protein